MLKDFRASLVLLAIMTAITGLAYPAVVTGLAQALFPSQAGGSLIGRGGHVVGSALIGQQFTKAAYFWGRPSATVAPDPDDPAKTVAAPYNASNSGASNLAPSAKALVDHVTQRRAALISANPGEADPPPADMLTASASGLDPHISPEAALWQVKRVAAARNAPVEKIADLVRSRIEGRDLAVFGEPRVNVLALNIALDERWPMK